MSIVNRSGVFPSLVDHLMIGGVDWINGDIRVALLSPFQIIDTSWEMFSDVEGECAAYDGYVAGGNPMRGRRWERVTDAPWWEAGTLYYRGDLVDVDGVVCACIEAGRSGLMRSTLKAAAAKGLDVLDGSVTWRGLGPRVTSWTSDNVTWANVTLATSSAVIYDRSGPVIAWCEFDTLTPRGGNVLLEPHARGWLVTAAA